MDDPTGARQDMVIDPCGCVWRGNSRDGYDLTTCIVHWLCDIFGLDRSMTCRRQAQAPVS
jgi:hypothetical protein